MSMVNVLVATTSLDLKTRGIAAGIVASVSARLDMTLVDPSPVDATIVDALLELLPTATPCALVLVGPPTKETDELAERWLAKRAALVALRVDVIEDLVHISVRNPGLNSVVNALRDLVDRAVTEGQERVLRYQLHAVGPADEAGTPAPIPPAPQRPLLNAAVRWLQRLLPDAVAPAQADGEGDRERGPDDVVQADDALDAAFDAACAADEAKDELLAVAARTFGLSRLEFRLMLLALAPELDFGFQRSFGLLLEADRRVGNAALFNRLLAMPPGIREDLAGGALARWLVFDGAAVRMPAAADEPLRLDPFLARWLLGERSALADDPRVHRAVRAQVWPGASLLQRREEKVAAANLLARLGGAGEPSWLVLSGDPAGWRALLELGAREKDLAPIRVELVRFAGVDPLDVEDAGVRVARLARLTGAPLLVDLAGTEASESADHWLGLFLAAVADVGSRAVLVAPDAVRAVALIGAASHELAEDPPLSKVARVAAVREAAAGADAYLTEESAQAIADRHPMGIDALERAMQIARVRLRDLNADDPALTRFVTACKDVGAGRLSGLADRIEPVFSLDEVVLPADRKQQLAEIVDNVRLAAWVLDEWGFREQLPYGRGVTALFHGPSGTGKTMAAMGVARRLGVQVLRLDLSRVVSKYIGDTEKNVDKVFTDGQQCGAAILIDEAEALLGKRSEIKDAHDRYSNIEVAYLLQRMETYEGVAILTTNLRQNLDPAFLRRLRFIVEFPRPDAEARERIWRQCLPDGSHELDDAAFRQLARKVDVTGGHLRQITVRAAFIAAAAGTRIGLEHVAQATRAELAKLGMSPVAIDVGRDGRAA